MKTKNLMKYLPARVSKYVYIWLIVIFLLLMIRVKWDKDWGLKLGNSMLVMNNYDQEIELSVEDRLAYEAEVQKYDDLINNFVPGTGEEIDLGNGMKGIVDNSNPNQDRFIKKAQNLAALGRNNKAIKTLIDASSYHEDSLTIMDTLAGIYDQANAYQLALNIYNDILSNNPDKYMDYIKSVIHMYINLEDDDKAGKLYIEYITAWGKADLQIVNWIRSLRDMEPMK